MVIARCNFVGHAAARCGLRHPKAQLQAPYLPVSLGATQEKARTRVVTAASAVDHRSQIY